MKAQTCHKTSLSWSTIVGDLKVCFPFKLLKGHHIVVFSVNTLFPAEAFRITGYTVPGPFRGLCKTFYSKRISPNESTHLFHPSSCGTHSLGVVAGLRIQLRRQGTHTERLKSMETSACHQSLYEKTQINDMRSKFRWRTQHCVLKTSDFNWGDASELCCVDRIYLGKSQKMSYNRLESFMQ